MQMMKSLTLLGNFTKGPHSKNANQKVGVLQCIDDVRHHALNHLDEFRWKKEIKRWTMQMTISLTLLGNFAKGLYNRNANPKVGVLQCIDDVRHHILNRLDEFRWNIEVKRRTDHADDEITHAAWKFRQGPLQQNREPQSRCSSMHRRCVAPPPQSP